MADTADGRVVIKVELDDGEAKKGLDNLGKKAEKVGEEVQARTKKKELIMNMDVDQKEAQRNLKNAERRLIGYQEKLEAKGMAKSALKSDLEAAQTEADALDAKLTDLRAKFSESMMGNARGGTIAKLSEAQLEQKAAIDNLQTQRNQIGDRITGINREMTQVDKSMQKVRDNIAATENTAGDWSRKLAECEESADGIDRKLKDIGDDGNDADKMLKKITDRIKGLAERVFIFSIITKALRSLRSWMMETIKTNDDARSAMAQLQGALLTLAQPLINVIIPAFITLVNVLTAVISRIAQLIAAISGKSLKSTTDAAKALNKQKAALKGTGKAAKEAGKSLAAFDEINQLSSNKGDDSGGGSGGAATDITPDFSFLDGVSDRLNDIADAILFIGAGLALWKLSDKLPSQLQGIATKIAGLLIAVGGLKLMWDALSDVMENGLNWGNMTELIAGAAAVTGGLALAFGKIGAGIGLIISSAALLVAAFEDISKNGVNLKNVLTLIAGLLTGGLGISLLTKSWVPLLIAAFASIVAAVLAWTGNLEEFIDQIKNFLSGLVDFVEGVFTGDMDRAGAGLKKMIKSWINMNLIVIESFLNLIIRGVNWVIDQINKIKIEVPEWVPGIGGKSWGPKISHMAEASLPRLAQGAVIPPNREFLAVLGDQKQGTNYEVPDAKLRQLIREEMNGGGSGEMVINNVLELDGEIIYRNQKKVSKRHGKSLVKA